MPKDMRHWINPLEESGELIRITKPVHPHRQMGALLYPSRVEKLIPTAAERALKRQPVELVSTGPVQRRNRD
jgi:hypothetical protein